jgi:hypothetical protein
MGQLLLAAWRRFDEPPELERERPDELLVPDDLLRDRLAVLLPLLELLDERDPLAVLLPLLEPRDEPDFEEPDFDELDFEELDFGRDRDDEPDFDDVVRDERDDDAAALRLFDRPLGERRVLCRSSSSSSSSSPSDVGSESSSSSSSSLEPYSS